MASTILKRTCRLHRTTKGICRLQRVSGRNQSLRALERKWPFPGLEAFAALPHCKAPSRLKEKHLGRVPSAATGVGPPSAGTPDGLRRSALHTRGHSWANMWPPLLVFVPTMLDSTALQAKGAAVCSHSERTIPCTALHRELGEKYPQEFLC